MTTPPAATAVQPQPAAELSDGVCPSCHRRVFSNGGHHRDCRLNPLTMSTQTAPGYCDRTPLDSQRFVNVWDEVTYYNDDCEGDR